jgi:hypothetical protein
MSARFPSPLAPESLVTLLGLLSAAAVAASGPDSVPAPIAAGPVARPVAATLARAADDTTRPRRRAVEISEGYETRLRIHRIASYTMPPLFATQYLLGRKMLQTREDQANGRAVSVDEGTRTAHQWVAGGVATLFAVNTVTGVWNLVESRHQPEGRALRTTHAILMLASDAGFAATGLVASNARNGGVDDARTHRNIALASMVPATAGAVLMWINQIRSH